MYASIYLSFYVMECSSFVVRYRNGSAGEILIFARHATKDNVTEIMFQESRETNYQNVQDQRNVLSRYNTHRMEKNMR